jgi:hypothetical protein
MKQYIWIFIVLFLLYIYKIENYKKRFNSVNYEKIKDKFKTGDVLLFNSHSVSTSQLIKTITNSFWSHCGIILKNENKTYICEFVDDLHTSGFQMKDLDTKIYNYNGIVGFRQINKEIDNIQFKQCVDKYKNRKFTPPFAMFFNYITNTKGNRKYMHCSEFVSTLLCDCNMIKSNNNNLITPKHYCSSTKNCILNKKDYQNTLILKLSPFIH